MKHDKAYSTEELTLKNGKRVPYVAQLAGSDGVRVYPEITLTREEKQEFRREISFERDVTKIFWK